jgi:pimeloyl-ACP methyl ester carboxylesterase
MLPPNEESGPSFLRPHPFFATKPERAIEQAALPKLFLWGMADPVSGRHISEHLRPQVADVNLVALEDVGHYPQLEVQELIVDRLLNFFGERM